MRIDSILVVVFVVVVWFIRFLEKKEKAFSIFLDSSFNNNNNNKNNIWTNKQNKNATRNCHFLIIIDRHYITIHDNEWIFPVCLYVCVLSCQNFKRIVFLLSLSLIHPYTKLIFWMVKIKLKNILWVIRKTTTTTKNPIQVPMFWK